MTKIIYILITVLIFLAFIPAIVQQIHNSTVTQQDTETFNPIMTDIPLNLTMATDRIISIDNISNGTHTLVNADYDDYTAVGRVTLLRNDSLGGGEVIIEMTNNDGVSTGASAVLIGLVVLVLIIGFIVWLSKLNKLK